MACIFVTLCYEKFTIRDPQKKKKILTCYMMMWHLNPHHITLGPHNIHDNFFKIINYLVQYVTTQNN